MNKAARDFVNGALAEGENNAEIERLANLSAIKYDQEREASAEMLGARVSTLDEAVKQQRRKSAKAAKWTAKSDVGELRRSAGHIIEHPKILDLLANEFAKVIAGEATNGKLLYLIATSRLFDKTMNAAIKGTSAGGKSEIRKRVLEFFPPESVVSFTSLSEKALIYYDGDFAHKILSMGEATATDEQEFQDYLLRELMSESRIRYPTVQKVGGELVAVTIEKEGPVAFLVTTTKSKLHPENETRMLSLEIDDSENQTKDVLRKVAQVEGLNHSAVQVDYGPWQDLQRWLELGERRVVVPFAAEMVALIPPVAARLRRDVGQVIRAIKAHALLHREQRGRDDAGQIVADIEQDYTTVRELLNSILAEGSGVAVNKGRSMIAAAPQRRRLPNRRSHLVLNFEHGGFAYTAGVGFFDDAGQQPAEIFLTTAKHGTVLDTNARDAAIAASLLLQHGCPAEALRRALTRNGDGSASEPLAHALDLLGAGK
jgi:hypothetical protein